MPPATAPQADEITPSPSAPPIILENASQKLRVILESLLPSVVVSVPIISFEL
jgi:hypothetical protein